MSVTQDILASYRRPGEVIGRLIKAGPREDRALIFLVLACLITFVAQLPRLARQAHVSGENLNMLMGGTLMAWMFVAPLMFYCLAFLAHLIMRLLKREGQSFGARLVLFWALLAASPVILLHGLTAGFVGEGAALTVVGVIWAGFFGWFVMSGLRAAYPKAAS